MVNERELTDKFNKTLLELKVEIRQFEETYLDYDPDSQGHGIEMQMQGFPVAIQNIKRKIQELRLIGVDEHRINEVINKILERIRKELLTILQKTNLSETERQISRHLNYIDSLLNFSYDKRKLQAQTREMWSGEIKLLEKLSIAEKDLVKANERVLQILKSLTEAAEKLE